jgi:hypothetical protein
MAYYTKIGMVDSKIIDLPFKFSQSGAVTTVNAQSAAAWKNKIISYVATARGSRVWYDRFGASISDALLFENYDTAATLLKESLSEAFVRWIPEVTLEEVLYNYDYSTGTLNFTVVYTLPTGSEDSITLSQSSVSSSGDTLQVGYNG